MPTEPSQPSGDDPMDEELTISQAAKEFRLSRASLNYWTRTGKIVGRWELSDLGVWYWKVKRGAVAYFLANRPKRGRPLKRLKPNA